MASIEITGKSVDEAKKAAAAKLGVSESEVRLTILEETKGLFGKSNVRVRAEVAAPQAAVEIAAPPKKGRGRAKAETAPLTDTGGQSEPLADVQEAMEEKPPAPVEKAARRNGRRKPATEEAQAPVEPDEPDGAAASKADADQLLDLVRSLISAGDLDVKASVTQIAGRYVNIEIDGRDVAFLVGKHGEVLNALQYLVNIVAGRRYDNGVRATLDGNNYRRRREDALTSLATKIAEQVKQRQEEAVLDALPAFERRIVHKALADYGGVQTYSEGEEPNRRVVIAPAQ